MNNCPVEILQNEWEFNQLLSIYKTVKPKNIIEIGSYEGGTLWHWINFNDEIKKIVSIDYPVYEDKQEEERVLNARDIWDDWTFDNHALFIIPVFAPSTDKTIIKKMHADFPNKDVDMLFIDGGHDYMTVKSDFDNYSPLVRQGGMIVFHDIQGLADVRRFWNEIKQQHPYIEIVENVSIGWGIGIIFK